MMRIMTFNLRFENDKDGQNAWCFRREMAVGIIRRYRPSVLGTQEGKWSQLAYLREKLPGYKAVMPGREPDKNIQCPTLFLSDEFFQIEEEGEFWLSKTPETHLSKDWDSAFPRMISYAEIRIEKTGGKILVAVTHLDHMGIEARYQQAKIISQWANDQRYPVILTGDFNDHPESRIHTVLTTPETLLHDTWQKAEGNGNTSAFTHHGFSGIPQVARMDWILVDKRFKVTYSKIIRDHYEGKYPSDHFPYMADIELM